LSPVEQEPILSDKLTDIRPCDDFADEMRRSALYYRQCGLSIIPVRGKPYTYGENDEEKEKNSKMPLVKWVEYQLRFATEDEIGEWFEKWPLANIGFVTGEISGVVVVDFDSRDAVLMARSRGYLDTPVARTGRGCHAYYRYPMGREVRNSADSTVKVDIRGNGGYIVLPPSIHYSGRRYEWVRNRAIGDLPFGELPKEFIVKSARTGNRERTGLKPLYHGVGKGSRNDALARLCGSWINDGLNGEECLTMAHVWNSMNNPPLSDREVGAVVKSIMRYRKVDQGYAGEMFSRVNNVFTLPVFTCYEKRAGKPGRMECRVPANSGTLAWTVSSNGEYGLGGAFDERVFSVIMELTARLRLPIRNPVNIGNFWEIAKALGMEKPCVDDYRMIANSIKRIATTSIDARLMHEGKTTLETMFHVFDKVLFKAGRADGGYYNMVYLSDTLLKNVNAGYLQLIDLKAQRPLKSSIARALHRVVCGSSANGCVSVTISYREICERVGLYRHDDITRGRQQLSQAHRELRMQKVIGQIAWNGDSVTYKRSAKTTA